MEVVASKKTISIGPLVDGKKYTRDLNSGKWFDGKGDEVYSLPHECKSSNGRRVYFHTETHKWVNRHGVRLPTRESADIHSDFKYKYRLDGEIELRI